MSFLHSCFIENSAGAREWLESIGYTINEVETCSKFILTLPKRELALIVDNPNVPPAIENCLSNFPLFKAITAMRDDSGLHQWHKADSYISVLWSDPAGNDHCGVIPEGQAFLWDLHVENANVFSGDFHKMDLDELINHFKK